MLPIFLKHMVMVITDMKVHVKNKTVMMHRSVCTEQMTSHPTVTWQQQHAAVLIIISNLRIRLMWRVEVSGGGRGKKQPARGVTLQEHGWRLALITGFRLPSLKIFGPCSVLYDIQLKWETVQQVRGTVWYAFCLIRIDW